MWELARYENPGFHNKFTLHFTAAMPLRVLTRTFVREFAWIAIHPTGRRSWESVARLTGPDGVVRFEPPKIEHSELSFRGFFGGGAALVLELYRAGGKRDPCRNLRFEHPAGRMAKGTLHSLGMAMREDPEKRNVSGRIEKDFVVQDAGSRQNVRQDVLDIDRTLSDFDEAGPRIARRRQWPDPALDAPAAGQLQRGRGPGFAGEPIDGDLRVRRQSVQVSISDISMAAELPPLAFRLLEPASAGNAGELEPLIDTLHRMQLFLPTVIIASSLCLLPVGKQFSQIGRNRRPCLIATFHHGDAPPTVLLDVDHAGGITLAALGVRFLQTSDLSANRTHR